MKKTISAILAAVMLTACAEVPDNVASKNEERQSSSSVREHPAEPESIPFSELRADVDKALAETYSNYDLAGGITVDLPEKLIKCDFVQADNYTDRAGELMDRLFDSSLTEGLTPEKTTEQLYTEAYMNTSAGFRNEERQLHYCLWDNGFLCFMKPLLFNDMIEDGETLKIYHADRGDDLSDSYQLGDRQVQVSEAVAAANDWLDKNYADLEPDYQISIKTVIARQNAAGEKILELYAHKMYKGIELDELANRIEDGKMKYISKSVMMIMKNGTDIDYLTNGDGIITPVEQGELDKVISLSSAMGTIEKVFTDFYDRMTVNDINLKYTLTPDYDPDPENGAPYSAPGTKVKGRLVWEFVIDVAPDVIADNSGFSSSHVGDVRRYIYIDAEDGSIDFEFDLNHIS